MIYIYICGRRHILKDGLRSNTTVTYTLKKHKNIAYKNEKVKKTNIHVFAKTTN